VYARVDGGVIAVNPDNEKTVTPVKVICVVFWLNTVTVPVYATVNYTGNYIYK
jgi:hypothetical protein